MCRTDALVTEQESLEQELGIIAENLTNLIRENARVAQDQKEYAKKEEKLRTIYGEKYNRFGLVNICIVEKITKFDNDIFLDFRAAGKSFAGSTIRLRMACP